MEGTEMQKEEHQLEPAGARERQTRSSVSVISDEAVLGASSLALVDDYSDMPSEMWGARHTLAFLGFLGFTTVYAMRVNLSVAIVAMVKAELAQNDTNITDSDTCPFPDDWEDQPSSNSQNGEFEWSKTTQGLVLGSFFYGYLFSNIPGGRAAEHFGGKIVMGLGVLLTGVLSVLSPACAEVSTGLFVAVRILEGLCEGVTFPAMNTLLASWVPPLERAKFTSLAFTGAQFGTVITLLLSGWLCDSDFLGGWPSVFYVFGGLGILWSVAWFLLVSNRPEAHPRISQDEKNYILRHCKSKNAQPVRIPWKALATSPAVLFLCAVHFGNNWGFYTLLTELPTYLTEIQHFDMKSNGVVSAMPYFVLWVFSLVYSNIMERVVAAGKLSIPAVRKISMIIGSYGPMLGLVAMCFVNCDKIIVIVVLCVAVGINGCVYSGFMCSHQDLSPNLAGTLLGITNTVGTIPGFVTPLVTGVITETQTLSAWRTVFLISSGVYLVTNTGYLLFVPASVQPWNEETPAPENEEKKY